MAIRVGDTVTRIMGGVPMELEVMSVTDQIIETRGGWDFCPKTGMEIDNYLGWGPEFGQSGSYLKELVT